MRGRDIQPSDMAWLAVALVCLVVVVIWGSISFAQAKETNTEVTLSNERIIVKYNNESELGSGSETQPPLETDGLNMDDVKLIAMVTVAEAEGEIEEGQRLVIDTILNRLESEYFPNTVHEVVYQPNQFSSMWDGRIDRIYQFEDVFRLVVEELHSRTNHDVLFFRTDYFSEEYGTPYRKVGNHYFSTL